MENLWEIQLFTWGGGGSSKHHWKMIFAEYTYILKYTSEYPHHPAEQININNLYQSLYFSIALLYVHVSYTTMGMIIYTAEWRYYSFMLHSVLVHWWMNSRARRDFRGYCFYLGVCVCVFVCVFVCVSAVISPINVLFDFIRKETPVRHVYFVW